MSDNAPSRRVTANDYSSYDTSTRLFVGTCQAGEFPQAVLIPAVRLHKPGISSHTTSDRQKFHRGVQGRLAEVSRCGAPHTDLTAVSGTGTAACVPRARAFAGNAPAADDPPRMADSSSVITATCRRRSGEHRKLFQGMFEEGVELRETADEASSGPTYIALLDPDGNPILIDQHRSVPLQALLWEWCHSGDPASVTSPALATII